MAELEIEWKRLTQVLNEAGDHFIELARENLTSNNSNASYNLYNSFEKIIEVGEDYYSIKISLADYWKYTNYGRGPGKMPPIDVIKNWIEVKHIEPTPDLNGKTPSIDQLSFLIARKIGNEGTEGAIFFEPAKEQTIRDFEQRIDLAIQEDVSDYILKITDEYMNRAFGK